MKRSVSIIIPAYNEEKNLEGAVRNLKTAVQLLTDYEIIIVDDGSTDQTEVVAKRIAREYPHIRIITHKKNMGIGMALRDGIHTAKKEYVTQFHGDNDTSGESMKLLFSSIGKADFISAYTANPEVRPKLRQIISRIFVIFMNFLFGLRMKYYTGFFLCKTKLLKNLPITARGFAFYPEAKVRLIKSGATYKEIPFLHTGRVYGYSKSITLHSLAETLRTILTLVIDVYIKNSYLSSKAK